MNIKANFTFFAVVKGLINFAVSTFLLCFGKTPCQPLLVHFVFVEFAFVNNVRICLENMCLLWRVYNNLKIFSIIEIILIQAMKNCRKTDFVR